MIGSIYILPRALFHDKSRPFNRSPKAISSSFESVTPLPVGRPFADIIFLSTIVPAYQIGFFRPSSIKFGKNAELFDDFKFNVRHITLLPLIIHHMDLENYWNQITLKRSTASIASCTSALAKVTSSE